jgi:hypothetical protein
VSEYGTPAAGTRTSEADAASRSSVSATSECTAECASGNADHLRRRSTSSGSTTSRSPRVPALPPSCG